MILNGRERRDDSGKLLHWRRPFNGLKSVDLTTIARNTPCFCLSCFDEYATEPELSYSSPLSEATIGRGPPGWAPASLRPFLTLIYQSVRLTAGGSERPRFFLIEEREEEGNGAPPHWLESFQGRETLHGNRVRVRDVGSREQRGALGHRPGSSSERI